MVNVIEVPFRSGTAWMVHTQQAPVVAFKISFKGGSQIDSKGKIGLAEMASQLLLGGAGEYDSVSFAQTLQEHAIRLETSVSKDSLDITVYALHSALNKAARLTNLMLTQPKLNKADLKRLIDRQVSYLQYEQQTPSTVARKTLWKNAFDGHAYANPTSGNIADIQKITVKDIKTYLDNVITLTDVIVGVAGDLKITEASNAINQITKGLPQTPPVKSAEKAVIEAGSTFEEMAIPQTSINFMMPGLARTNKDFYAWVLLDSIMGGSGFSSRLMEVLREQQGLTYGIGTGLVLTDAGNFWYGGMSTSNDKAGIAWQGLMSEIEKAAANGFTEEELDTAKAYEAGNFMLHLDNNQKLAGVLVSMQDQNLGKDYLTNRKELLNKVTLTQINNLAKTLLSKANMHAVFVGQPAGDGLPITGETK